LPFTEGVGQEEHPLSSVGGPDISGLDPGDLHFVTVLGQPSGHDVQRPPKESSHVLDDDGLRLRRFDDPRVLPPQSGPLTVEPGSLAGEGEVLAGEPTAQDVDRRGVVELPDIGVPLDAGPVLREHCPAERVHLTLPHDVAHTGSLEPKFEGADPTEQGSDPHDPSPHWWPQS
jgi:hypothetical protein